MREFNEELHPRAPKGDENGGQFIDSDSSDVENGLEYKDKSNIEKDKYYKDTIKYLEDKTGVIFTKSKSSNSYYGEKNGLKIRISDHHSKFAEKQYNIFNASAIDLPFIGMSRIAMVRAINQTDPCVNYKKGDKIRHRAESIGYVTYIKSDYKNEYVLVKRDNKEVKYFMEAFYTYLEK